MARQCYKCRRDITWNQSVKKMGTRYFHTQCAAALEEDEKPPTADMHPVSLDGLGESQKALFDREYDQVKKDPTAGVLLALFLGGLGVHRYYLKDWLGLLYLVFCWTLIPSLVGLIEAFLMSERIRGYNQAQAKTIAARIRATTPAEPATRAPRPPGDEQERVPCPECAELILPAAKKCRYCGAALGPSA